jgi:hypothetical protein
MTATLLTLTLITCFPAQTTTSPPTRPPHPFAPSLPQLSDAEEDELDQIIDRFILYDTGKLRGEEGKQAVQKFQRLGPEAIFALIRGLNRAANFEASCPAVVIAKKVARILNATTDLELLEFARENIGAGVTASRHQAVLRDLRTGCIVRKRVVTQNGPALRAGPGPKPLRALTVTELAEAAGREGGPVLRSILVELEKRQGEEVIATLGSAAGSYDGEMQQLARDLLGRHLSRQGAAVLKDKLKDDRKEVRAAAARVVGTRGLRLGGELIDLLTDAEADVREVAHQALVRLSRGTDFGPARDAAEAERAEAARQWRGWWAKQGGR